jgi:hypothetical protein
VARSWTLEAAVTLLRRSEPCGAPTGELRGAVEAYSVLRGEIVVQLRDAELVSVTLRRGFRQGVAVRRRTRGRARG